MANLLLGVDIGTTATKAILLDPAGSIVAEASLPSDVYSPHPGWAEMDPDGWWRNLIEIVPPLLKKVNARPEDVAGVGISGMLPALLCLDPGGSPLRRSIQQNDARAIPEIAELRRRLDGVDVLTRTGSPITQQSIGPTVLWLRRHEPDVIRQTVSICGSYDWITRRLCRSNSTEINWALESGLFDFETESWAEDICDDAEVDPTWLGDVRRPSEVVGGVVESSEVGLLPGTPVVAGAADLVASAFSAGLIEDGDMLVKLGGSGDLLFTSSVPVVDERLYLDYHLTPGKYLPNGCMATSGALIRWFQRLVGGPSLAELDAEAEAVGVGAGGLVALPYFLGEKTPINDPEARGMFIGLHLGHERGHLFRAVLESIAFGFAHHLEVLRERGLEPRRVRITNGGSRSRVWRQIVADVLGLPMESILDHPGSSMGAAYTAGIGTGVIDGWGEIDRFIQADETIEPIMDNHKRYRELYAVYRELYPATLDQQHRLARWR
jgi:xylulokinase